MTCVINWENNSKICRRLFCVVSAVFLTIAMASCDRPSRRAVVQIGALNGPGGLSLVRLRQDGAADHDFPERYIIRNDPTLIKAMMTRGDLDLALVPLTTGALLYNSGLPYELVAISVWGTLFIVGEDSAIQRLGDLKGKRVFMMAKNMTPDILFRHILSKHGIDPDSDLTLDYTFPTPTELASALQMGRVSLGIVSEPMMSHILRTNGNLQILFDLTAAWEGLYPSGPPLAQTAVMGRKDWIAENALQLRKWCDRYAAGVRWVNAHPDSAGALAVQQEVVRNADVAASAIRRCRFDFQFASAKKVEILNYLEVLYNENPRMFGNKIPDESFFYTR